MYGHTHHSTTEGDHGHRHNAVLEPELEHGTSVVGSDRITVLERKHSTSVATDHEVVIGWAESIVR